MKRNVEVGMLSLIMETLLQTATKTVGLLIVVVAVLVPLQHDSGLIILLEKQIMCRWK
jgi:hypothetical protein